MYLFKTVFYESNVLVKFGVHVTQLSVVLVQKFDFVDDMVVYLVFDGVHVSV